MIGVSMMVGVFYKWDLIASIYSNSPEVIFLIQNAIPVYAIYISIDYTQNVCAGILRGMGYQSHTTIINLITYWVFVVPLAYYLCFIKKWGLLGLFAAFPIGSIFQIIAMLYLIFKSDWV